ncbi:hypothetical protein L4D09_20305 [Photobacterium makurazakiensis]|uniref:hypothetical protein n=1 Tax=Photobacterium TaxID=657 RepID=UPI003D150491
MKNQDNHNTAMGAPWVLPLLITLLLTMQLSVKADDIEAQRVTIPDGQIVYAWEGDDTVDYEQHIPHIADKQRNVKE